MWTVPLYSECISKLMTELNIVDPILVGHSFGGRVIIHMIAERRLKARKVILVDSAGISVTIPRIADGMPQVLY